MPRHGVNRTDSQSDKQLLFSSKEGETDSSESSTAVAKGKSIRGKRDGIHASPISKPKMHIGKENRGKSILSNAAGPDGKGQHGPNGKSPSHKSTSGNRSWSQQTAPLLEEVDNSWESTGEEGRPLNQEKGKSGHPGLSSPVSATSKPALIKAATSGATSVGNKTVASKTPPAKSSGRSNEQDSSSLVEDSSDQGPSVASPSRASKHQGTSLPKASPADPGTKKASSPRAADCVAKLATRQSQRGLMPIEMVQEQIAKVKKEPRQERMQRPSPVTLARMNAHKLDLIALMTDEDSHENAEKLYSKVAEICTDTKLESWQRLSCLRGVTGKPCRTLKQDVNACFDAWVIEKYVDNHAPKSQGLKHPEDEKDQGTEEEKQSLLSPDDEVGNDNDNINRGDESDTDLHLSGSSPSANYDQQRVLARFKSTLSWWEQRKIDNLMPTGKFAKDPVRKAELQKVELLRKMQKRLTAEERQLIRTETRKYHDLLANSGLPILHIAVKNESGRMVMAYLLAVMAFAPFDIKKKAIQATQYQGLQAFYWIMTHSTTDMIKMFVETVVESDFLFHEEKKEILEARRPDGIKNSIWGVTAFHMAMALGDTARADAFMSQLLKWDPNCKIRQYSEIKTHLLEGLKTGFPDDKAKVAALNGGHRELVERYNQYVDSSHLRRDDKELLYSYTKYPVDKKYMAMKVTEQDEKENKELIGRTFKLFNVTISERGDLPEDFEMAPGVAKPGHTRIRDIVAKERQASILKMNNKPVPEHLQRTFVKDVALAPYKDLNQAGRYARLSTVPMPKQSEKRRTDGDRLLGPPPAMSKETRRNAWLVRKQNHTLPPRSASYASGLVDLPSKPASMPALPRLEELSPVKLTPSPGRRSGQATRLPDGTPTRLVGPEEF